MKTIKVLDPVAKTGQEKTVFLPNIQSLKNKRICYISNGWKSLGILWEAFDKVLKTNYMADSRPA